VSRLPDRADAVDRAAAVAAAGRRRLRAAVSPDRVAVAASTVGFDAALFAALRFGPAYVHDLGAGALGVGLFGAVVLAAVAAAGAVPRVGGEGAGSGGLDPVAAAGALAGLGLGAWTLAPDWIDPGPPWLLAVGGGALVAVWVARVPRTARGFPAAGPLGLAADAPAPATLRTAATAGAVLVGVALLVTADGTVPAVQFLAALAAALGLVAATLVATAGGDSGAGDAGARDEADGRWRVDPDRVDRDPAPGVRRAAGRARRRLAGLGRALVASRGGGASVLLADTLVRLSVALASVFVVLTVTGVLQLSTTVAGTRVGPAGTFGLLVCVEVVVAAAAARLGPRLADAVGPYAVVVAGDAAAVAFPLLLVSVAPSVPVVAALFAGFGARFVGAGHRRDLVAAAARAVDVPPDAYRRYRTGVAAAGPLVGGAAYAVSPVLAFGAATAVGTVGVWEFCHLALRRRAGGPAPGGDGA
jgi:hypothetical protein